jgi:hypothetical protein
MSIYTDDQNYNKYLKEVGYLNNVLSTNDVLKMNVATSGILLAGTEVSFLF